MENNTDEVSMESNISYISLSNLPQPAGVLLRILYSGWGEDVKEEKTPVPEDFP